MTPPPLGTTKETYRLYTKQQCKSVLVDLPKVKRARKRFPTGSQYEGTWDELEMSGTGQYTFPNGVIYVGELKNGIFHGDGELQYPNGEVLRGTYHNGCLVERTLIFPDGLHYSEHDCQVPDRRFTLEYEKGVQPAFKSYLTSNLPTREIPPGYYDTEDGFYNPVTGLVHRDDDISAILRSPSDQEQKWIVDNCRSSPVEQVGPRPDLYETWLEPETDPGPPPLPASISKATEHLFDISTSDFGLVGLGEEYSSSSKLHLNDYSKWLRRYKLAVSRSRSRVEIID